MLSDQKSKSSTNLFGSSDVWSGKSANQSQSPASHSGFSSFFGLGDRDDANTTGKGTGAPSAAMAGNMASNSLFESLGQWAEGIKRKITGGDSSTEKPPEQPQLDPQQKAEQEAKERKRKEGEAFSDRDAKRGRIEMELRAKKDPQAKEKAAGKMISDGYVDDAHIGDIPKKDPEAKVGNLGNKDEKIEYLKTLTQQDSSDPTKQDNKNYCGPTTMIAAAMYLDGPKGLNPLIEKMHKDVDSIYGKKNAAGSEFNGKLSEIQKKIADGELTNKDVDKLKEMLYSTMHGKQLVDKRLTDTDQVKDGIHEKIMRDYLIDTGMMDKMKKNNMSIRNIDNDGDADVNHYFLRIGNEKSKTLNPIVYDPYARKDGQVIDGQNQNQADIVSDYHNAAYHDMGFEDPAAKSDKK